MTEAFVPVCLSPHEQSSEMTDIQMQSLNTGRCNMFFFFHPDTQTVSILVRVQGGMTRTVYHGTTVLERVLLLPTKGIKVVPLTHLVEVQPTEAVSITLSFEPCQNQEGRWKMHR